MAYAEIGIVVIAAVAYILQETFHDRSRDDVAGVVRLAETLECDADHLSVLQHGAAGVAWIDRRIDLHNQVGVRSAVRIGLEIDA